MSSRKRRAPGASPQPTMQSYQQDVPADQYMPWPDTSMNANMSAFTESGLYNSYNTNNNRVVSLDEMNGGMSNGNDMNNGQLVRRNPNQQLATSATRWDGYPVAQPWEPPDDEEELEQKAAAAKKDAQAKRKQIPPFVQKLSSFLDNNKNENLIRWSDDGSSFIVLDEDEFARTLIPELFKHNNYASFVRQLNMYGFHKKVGLSDNSMKASETKAKAPSEYYNKYFRRGRPELLWLIQKPKNPTAAPKRKRDEDGKADSDEERKYVQDTGGGGFVEELAVRSNDQMAMIPRSEYNSLRVEVRELQQQQKIISNVLGQIKRQNEELYSRATSFQALHDRHENSINAILTFLATFYNRSLEGNANSMNLADMFPAARQQHHGNVVDVDDFPSREMTKSPQIQRTKRPLAILPAPASSQADLLSPPVTGRATTMSPTVRPSQTPVTRSTSRQPVFKHNVQQSRPQSTLNPQTGRDSASISIKPESPSNLPEASEIMSAIESANASASANPSTGQSQQFDFPAALSNFETQNGNVPLTPQQRTDVLSLIANNTPGASAAVSNNNALTNPSPPEFNSFIKDLNTYAATQQQLDLLQKMSDEQNSRVQSLQERLTPLSPSGSIPGLTDGEYFNAGLGEPGQYDLDLDDFVQDHDYFPHTSDGQIGNANIASAGLPDFNFGSPSLGVDSLGGTGGEPFAFTTSPYTDPTYTTASSGSGIPAHATSLLSPTESLGLGMNLGLGENRVESVSSGAPSPAAGSVGGDFGGHGGTVGAGNAEGVGVEDGGDEGTGNAGERKRSPKRRRR